MFVKIWKLANLQIGSIIEFKAKNEKEAHFRSLVEAELKDWDLQYCVLKCFGDDNEC